jgi:uncharacterized phosphosugar-binding protein
MDKKSLLDEVQAELGPELKALEKKWYEKGKADARGGGHSTAVAEKLADRAGQLMAATPGLSSVAAVRRAYEEAGVPLE